MKKKYVIGIAIISVIIVIALSFVIYKVMQENGRKYEVEEVKQYNYFVVKQNDLAGVMDKKGNTIIAIVYDDIKIPNPEKAIFVCYKDDYVKVLNERKEEILTQYHEVEPIRLKNIASDLMYEKSVLKYSENGKYGLVDFSGKQIAKPEYEEIDSLAYKEGELLVKKDGKYGVINIKGNKLVEIAYELITVDGYYTDNNQYQYAGYIVSTKTEEGYRYGYINYKGDVIVKPEYNELERIDDIEDNENAYLIGAKNGQYGVIKNETVIVPNEYQSIRYDKTNNVLVVEKSRKYGISNLEGKLIVPVEYTQIDITGIYLYAQNEQGTTIYNGNGTQANIDTNIAILNTSNERYRIRINNQDGTQYGVIGKDGKQIIKEEYNYIEYLYDNYFIASKENGKLGIIDDKEAVKIEIKYDAIQRIEGTDLVQTGISATSLTQIYDNQMKLICEMKNAIIEMQDTYLKVYNETENKYFSKEGKELSNLDVYPNNKLITKMENGKWGFVDRNGNKIVDYQYEKVTEFNEYGFASVKKDGKWGSINEQGEEVAKTEYELKGQLAPSFIGKYYKVTYGFGEFYYTDAK